MGRQADSVRGFLLRRSIYRPGIGCSPAGVRDALFVKVFTEIGGASLRRQSRTKVRRSKPDVTPDARRASREIKLAASRCRNLETVTCPARFRFDSSSRAANSDGSQSGIKPLSGFPNTERGVGKGNRLAESVLKTGQRPTGHFNARESDMPRGYCHPRKATSERNAGKTKIA